MTDVFISYAREDRSHAQRVAQVLESRGLSVWWDWDLIGGSSYRSEIRRIIGESAKVLVLWSRHSVQSAFVIDEATEARKLGKLVPVLIDEADLPFGFGDLHTILLHDPDREIESVVAALQGRPPPRAAANPRKLRKLPIRWSIIAIGLVVVCALGIYWGLGQSGFMGSAMQNLAQTTSGKPMQAVGPRLALVIGNANYKNTISVPNAARDAETIAQALAARGFNVIREVDVERDRMIELISDFERSLAINGGVGVFYYAGHGLHMDGEDIMLPVNTRAATDSSLVADGVNLTKIQQEIQSRTLRKWIDNGVVSIYAASKGQGAMDSTAPGSTELNSPFAQSILSALIERKDDLSGFFQRVREGVEQSVKPLRQTPDIAGQLRENFFFNQPDRDPPERVSRILLFDASRDNPFTVSR
jgi:hypothetical protein